MALIEPGHLHRLALAVDDAAPAHDWFQRVLGAGALNSDGHPDDIRAGGEADLEGTDVRLFRIGGYPIILLAKGIPGGPVAKFIERYGPGVHSLAWEVDDMWSAQNLLMERGIRIGAVNIPGRHFFMHPRDTHGVLMEWTDDTFGGNQRREDEGGGRVDIEGLAWVTASVDDAESTAAFLTDLAGASLVTGNAQGPEDREQTIDLDVGDVTLRLVTPLSSESPYAIDGNSARLCSFALRVADLSTALVSLEDAGVPVVRRETGFAATDPAATFGLPIEWTT
jgi:catechol 2,3-dioxygenase-like lactoylglutathione lyase family enzyme